MNRKSRAQLLSLESPAALDEAIQTTKELLLKGEVVAVPTETVYGLAANALDPAAVARIYQVKGRPAQNPLIVHVASFAWAKRCAAQWPGKAEALARAFWPGPLTIVLKKSPQIPSIVTASNDTVAIRWPSHPFMQRLIKSCDFPLAAPSANLSSRVSPTTAEHVQKSLGDRIPLIVDGGHSSVGIESTVVDLTETYPRILRPGMIHAESIEAVVGKLAAARAEENANRLKSPGLLMKHYSPKAKLRILEWRSEAELEAKLAMLGLKARDCHVIAYSNIPLKLKYARVAVIPHDAEAYARAIYAELHLADEESARMIVVEEVPDTPAWQGVRDRLKRAAS